MRRRGVAGYVDGAHLLPGPEERKALRGFQQNVQVDGHRGDFHRKDLQLHPVHPADLPVQQKLGPGHRPDRLMGPGKLDGVAVILVEELRHGVLDQDSPLKDPQLAPAVCVSGCDEDLFFIVIFHWFSPIACDNGKFFVFFSSGLLPCRPCGILSNIP